MFLYLIIYIVYYIKRLDVKTLSNMSQIVVFEYNISLALIVVFLSI
jgi:hypothetical protein